MFVLSDEFPAVERHFVDGAIELGSGAARVRAHPRADIPKDLLRRQGSARPRTFLLQRFRRQEATSQISSTIGSWA
jgi:hypothetical protein